MAEDYGDPAEPESAICEFVSSWIARDMVQIIERRRDEGYLSGS